MMRLCLRDKAGPLWELIRERVRLFAIDRIPARSRGKQTRDVVAPEQPVQLFVHRYSPGQAATGMPPHEDATRLAAVVINLTGDHDTDALYWIPTGDLEGPRRHLARDKYSMAIIAPSVLHGVEEVQRSSTRMTLNIFV
jgi:hypothetical protein